MDNKNEKKQKNGLFISWVDLILYLIISFSLMLVCVLDTVSTIGELKEKYIGINGYIFYGLWFIILWDILIIHYLSMLYFWTVSLMPFNSANVKSSSFSFLFHCFAIRKEHPFNKII